MQYSELMDLIFDNLKKIIYPEELFEIDTKLSKQELLILFLLDRYGEIIMSQLADYINIPMSTATGIVDRLVKKKYIQRERSETDRRVVALVLSEQGKEIINEVKDSISNYVDIVLKGLTEEEKSFLINIIPKMMNLLSNKDSNISKESDKPEIIKKIEIE